MGKAGRAPNVGEIYKFWLVAVKGVCAECRDEHHSVEATPDLEPGGNSSLVCPRCEESWAVPGGELS